MQNLIGLLHQRVWHSSNTLLLYFLRTVFRNVDISTVTACWN